MVECLKQCFVASKQLLPMLSLAGAKMLSIVSEMHCEGESSRKGRQKQQMLDFGVVNFEIECLSHAERDCPRSFVAYVNTA